MWPVVLLRHLSYSLNFPILPASPIAFFKRLRYIYSRKLKVTHSSFIKLAERGLDGLTPLIRWPSGSARLSKSKGQRIYFRCFCCNILISSHLIIVFFKKSRYICSGESQRVTLPLKGSPLSNLLKKGVCVRFNISQTEMAVESQQGFHHSTGSGAFLRCLCYNCNIFTYCVFQEIVLYSHL